MRICLDDVAESFYESFQIHMTRFGHLKEGERVAFFHALSDHLERVEHEVHIDDVALKYSMPDYEEYISEKTGCEIGLAINKNEKMRNKFNIKSFMGKVIGTEAYVLKLDNIIRIKKEKNRV